MRADELGRIIVDEVQAAIARRRSLRCRCHGAPLERCPDHVHGVRRAGVAPVDLRADGTVPVEIASLIDHTLLKPDVTHAEIERLCEEAREFRFAAVCVNPAWVATAATLLGGRAVGVCSVVGFPLGAAVSEVKEYEARRAIFDGATEIDVMMNVGALKSGDLQTVAADMSAVVAVCRECGALSKVIIEAALLTEEEKVAACVLATTAGADYVKTSTGFGPGGATVSDVSLMRRVVGANIGVKAAGGVRDYDTATKLVVAGASRIGTSAGVKIVQESRRR